MCGLTGFWAPPSAGLFESAASLRLQAMVRALHHRGPDAQGQWQAPEVGLALGHARLAILDLSPAGQQPMMSPASRYTVVFNGEIYNHLELRARLAREGHEVTWRGHADTETLLAGFEAWGIVQTLQAAVGMFALAIWDAQTRTLTLARDRLGEKPLYYGWADGTFLFGSELKALRTWPGFPRDVCREALAQYLRFNYVPAPRTIHPGVFKLEPGCLLTIQGQPPATAPAQPLRPGSRYGSLSLTRWWSLADVVIEGANTPITDATSAVNALESVLTQAVQDQCLADVPLGAFLSGGVDSSTIVALMQAQASHPVKTFTLGFDEPGYDESPHALAVARHLGTDHQTLQVTAAMAQAVIPQLPQIYDEPFADSSQIPTFLVCHAARQHVTVALSGDAGDELFGGYNRYVWGPAVWRRVGWLPLPLRQLIGHGLTMLPPAAWNALARGRLPQLGQKLHKLAERLNSVRSLDDLYRSLVTEINDPAKFLVSSAAAACALRGTQLDDPLPIHGLTTGEQRMMYWDSLTYLPDDILCKVDRAAMASSLETRVPFLDHRVIALAWRLPLDFKLRAGQGKWALRQVLYRHVPPALIERPKAGFALPLGAWLRGPLREWAEAQIMPRRLIQEGYWQVDQVHALWRQHQSQRYDHTAKLWSILMFQAWLESNQS